jgi:DNA replication and repair protein RecF
MYLTHLSLTNFRCFSRLELETPRRILLLVGQNAQGKTTILEACYYLATFESFHTQTDRQLINFIAAQDSLPVTRLVAHYSRHGAMHKLEVRLILENGSNGGARLRREILLDGVKKSASDAVGHLMAVLFLPQMTQILEGGPDERRQYINQALVQVVPGYAVALNDYQQALSQRNALLKQLNEKGGDPSLLDTWDELLAKRGAIIIHARIKALVELERQAAQVHHILTHQTELLRLYYQPAFDPLPKPNGQIALPIQTGADRSALSLEQIQNGFLQRLSELHTEEIARGVTTIGPHRDELRVIGNGIDLGDFGSRGQIRTAILSLKLAEVAWMKERSGEWPLLLLDEILAELDTARRADLMTYLGEYEQAFLSTADRGLFSNDFVGKSTIWQVSGGTVNPVDL